MTLEDQIRAIVRDELAKREKPAKAKPDPVMLSTSAAADLADMTAGTIRRWISEGKLRGYKVGRAVRVRRSDLEALLTAKPRNDSKLTPEQLADIEDRIG